MKRVTVIELLDYLDGNGLVITDYDLINLVLLQIADKNGDINPN